MGFRHAAVLGSVSFFLGILFICFNVDHKVLYAAPLTDKIVDDGFEFYTTFFNAPGAVKGLLHAMMGLGILSLISKLHNWDESALFFDGSSLGAFVCGVILYASVVVPALRIIVTPLESDTRQERIESLRILAAANTLIIICLVAVLVMQAGQEYAQRYEAREMLKLKEQERKAAEAAGATAPPDAPPTTSPEEKKNQ
ncbi:ER membrane protein SH3 [Ceratobasidium theobromae]|uniref:ER membrane protein SH3 n=1 Tax=Ceratobasidium theobromae TaxID=1582974 RepID=A0A5N5QRU7_9AGAM|nr:ER membrane protein SH3 [Ceratobasidium theobromae]